MVILLIILRVSYRVDIFIVRSAQTMFVFREYSPGDLSLKKDIQQYFTDRMLVVPLFSFLSEFLSAKQSCECHEFWGMRGRLHNVILY